MARRLPKIEVREVHDDYIKFVLYDTDLSIANALRRVCAQSTLVCFLLRRRSCARSGPKNRRRVMISHVATIAIDLVDMHANSTVLHDEVSAGLPRSPVSKECFDKPLPARSSLRTDSACCLCTVARCVASTFSTVQQPYSLVVGRTGLPPPCLPHATHRVANPGLENGVPIRVRFGRDHARRDAQVAQTLRGGVRACVHEFCRQPSLTLALLVLSPTPSLLLTGPRTAPCLCVCPCLCLTRAHSFDSGLRRSQSLRMIWRATTPMCGPPRPALHGLLFPSGPSCSLSVVHCRGSSHATTYQPFYISNPMRSS